MPKKEILRTETIDHTAEPLGPTWLPRNGARAIERDVGDVMTSGRGRSAADAMIEAVEAARDVVLVVSFLLADAAFADALLAASSRGVRVYVLTASEARLKAEPRGDFNAQLLEQHVALLTRLGGRVLLRSSELFHAKLLLVDPGRGEGFLLTANLTREALERNEEIVVRLTPREVAAAREWFVAAFWNLAEHELLDAKTLRHVTARHSVRLPSDDVLTVTWSGSQTHSGALLELIDSARRSLVVSCFGWDENAPVVDLIAQRAAQGLAVTVLARVRERAMPALVRLAASGARVVGFDWLHGKAISVDGGTRAWVGSANFEPRGLEEGFELGVVLDRERAQRIDEVLADWSGCARWELRANARVGETAARTDIRRWDRGRFVDVRVEAERRLELSDGSVLPAAPRDPIHHSTVVAWCGEAAAAQGQAGDSDAT